MERPSAVTSLAEAVRPIVVDDQFHLDRRSLHRQRSLIDLGDAGRVRQHELYPAGRRYPDVTGLRMQGTTVVLGLRSLAVAEERFTDVAERDFFEVAERLDGRVLARALTCPGAQQGSERSDAGMEIGHASHLTGSRSAHRGYPLPVAADTVHGLPDKIRACLFDLDGVLTDTASVHRKAWKAMFDAYLSARAERTGQRFVPFDIGADYQTYVDGKKRDDGVRSFLDSRGITVPEGHPDDDATPRPCRDWATGRTTLFQQTLRADGVEVFEGSRRYLDAVTAAGLAVAVVSSSSNTREVLEVTGLAEYVQVRVDGVTIREEGHRRQAGPGLVSACRPTARRVAGSSGGVRGRDRRGGGRARAGHFGVVIGVDRVGQAEALRRNGADVVVADLAELLDS